MIRHHLAGARQGVLYSYGECWRRNSVLECVLGNFIPRMMISQTRLYLWEEIFFECLMKFYCFSFLREYEQE